MGETKARESGLGIDLGDMSLWVDGPPHDLFERIRGEDPVHWSEMDGWDNESGFWSITLAEDVHSVSRDWETFSSERGGILAADHSVPIEFQNAMFIGMDPPRHDRIKHLFQRGFTPKRIAEHEDEIQAITERVLDGLEGRNEFDLVADVAQPVVGRVIGSFLGTPEEDDEVWADFANRGLAMGDDELQPEGQETVIELIQRGHRPRSGDGRRAPRTSDRRPHERLGPLGGGRRAARGLRDRLRVRPARLGGQRQHQGHLLQRDALAAAQPGADGASWSTTRRRSSRRSRSS